MAKSRKTVTVEAEYIIHLSIKKLENGEYLATSGSLPGLIAQGRTISETIDIARDVARKLIESYLEHGDPLPKKLMPLGRNIKTSITINMSS